MIKERSECRIKIQSMLKKAGAETFEELYLKLRHMYWEALLEMNKPKDQRKYSDDMRKQLEKMDDESHPGYVRLLDERDRRKRSNLFKQENIIIK